MELTVVGLTLLIVGLLFGLFCFKKLRRVRRFKSKMKAIKTAASAKDLDGLMSILYDIRGVKRDADGDEVKDTAVLLSSVVQGLCDICDRVDLLSPSLEYRTLHSPIVRKDCKYYPLTESLHFIADLKLGSDLKWVKLVVEALYNLSPTHVQMQMAATDKENQSGSAQEPSMGAFFKYLEDRLCRKEEIMALKHAHTSALVDLIKSLDIKGALGKKVMHGLLLELQED